MNEREIKRVIKNLKIYLTNGVDCSGNILTWEKYEAIQDEISRFENYLRMFNSNRKKLDHNRMITSYNKEIIRVANFDRKQPLTEDNIKEINSENF